MIIESPSHTVHLQDLSPTEIGDILLAYKKRIEQLCANDSISYVQVFKNNGASHSEMLALPIVPSAVSARVDSMKEYFAESGH